MEDKCTCSLNYEAEYNRVRDELEKAKFENCRLHSELQQIKTDMIWHRGFRSAVELIFRGDIDNE